jgi:hypothetical protein
MSRKGSVQSVHGTQNCSDIVRHDSVVNRGGVGSSPTSGPMVSKTGFRSDLKSAAHVLDTLIEVTHYYVALSQRHMLRNDVVHTLCGAIQIATVAIYGGDLNLTNMLYPNADGDVFISCFCGMGKRGDRETFGPIRPTPPLGNPSAVVLAMRKYPCNPKNSRSLLA